MADMNKTNMGAQLQEPPGMSQQLLVAHYFAAITRCEAEAAAYSVLRKYPHLE